MEKQESSEQQVSDLGDLNSVNNESKDEDYILEDVYWELENGELGRIFGKVKEYEQRIKSLENIISTINEEKKEGQELKKVLNKMKDYELRILDLEDSSSIDNERREQLQVLDDVLEKMKDYEQRIRDLENSNLKNSKQKQEGQALEKILRKMEDSEQRLVDLENLVSVDKEKKKERQALEDVLNKINDCQNRILDLKNSINIFVYKENNQQNQKLENIVNKIKNYEERIMELEEKEGQEMADVLNKIKDLEKKVQILSNENNGQKRKVDAFNKQRRSLQEFVNLLETQDIVDGIVFEITTDTKIYQKNYLDFFRKPIEEKYIDVVLSKPLKLKRVVIFNNTNQNKVQYLRFKGKGNLSVEESRFDGIGIWSEVTSTSLGAWSQVKLYDVKFKNVPENSLLLKNYWDLITMKQVDIANCRSRGIVLDGCSLPRDCCIFYVFLSEREEPHLRMSWIRNLFT
eukprot:TRINITY_DN3456_c1_g1_i14.p1 TRINITY_DN3456_c1_g1~~TRINITY_DN3456_c1_g1_i14.p1  ORF type:complete len:539 (-),score=66.99 TRINITY_DN3456_c1_g1_i14:197-1576(-)